MPAIAETRAGTAITNSATLTVGTGADARIIVSNEVRLVTAERLDVTLSTPVRTAVAIPPAGGGIVPMVLTNTGNGDEVFAVAALASDASATIRTIAIDADDDGAFDAARDIVLAAERTPSLVPGATLHLLIVIDPAMGPATARGITVSARAETGSGAAGADFPGRGDGGGDALTGATGAAAQVFVPLVASDPTASSLVKSQSVRAPDGTTNAVRGATITYVIEARFAGPAASARLHDPIPVGTAYVADSLRLDAAPLTDAADTDPGAAGAAGIDVALGDIAAPAIRTVQFEVIIQ